MDTRKLIVPFLLCCLALTLFLGTVKIGHATTLTVNRTFTSETDDGHLARDEATYGAARNATTGEWKHDDHASVGQLYGGGQYKVSRGATYFDTSIIPDNATLLSATLSLYVEANLNTTTFNITIQTGNNTYPSEPLELADFYYTFYSGDGGTRNISSIIEFQYWNITVNSQGLSWINLAAKTKFWLVSSKDIDNTAPTDAEEVQFSAAEKGSTQTPKLYVTYTFEGNQYVVHGPYYENGAVADCTVNVTLQIENMASNSTILNGTDGVADTVTFQIEQLGVSLSWNITTTLNMTRYIQLTSASSQEYWIFLPDPDTPCYLYTITLNDFVGITDATLESQTVLSGFYKTVEREPFVAGNSMPFYLSWGKHYAFVLTCDKGTKTWLNIVPAATSDIQLVITLDDFPIMLQTLNVSISVIRQNNTCVSVSYSDSDFETTNGTVTIWHSDNYTDTTDNVTTWNGDTLNLDWYTAEETVDYWVNITATKNGQTYNWVLTAPHIITVEPWAGIFDPLGVWPVPSQYLAGAFVLFTVMALFTQANMAGGLIFSVIVAAILNYIRWLNVSWSLIAVAFAMAIIVALEEARKKHAVGA